MFPKVLCYSPHNFYLFLQLIINSKAVGTSNQTGRFSNTNIGYYAYLGMTSFCALIKPCNCNFAVEGLGTRLICPHHPTKKG